ncbi:hypothetical protein SAM23877_6409 [Streptomyces ambofaciens ATCC 23877]|uniref:Uncharacterized protein n=1 Tax=Streptomyces ambofaciens (strain ATCC 23877 / 3486 / DSM 40053 / JCM 4204 / NBRC 12836 / NRRL B-2516) TaxID=278992 RepID=A0A0K2B2E9_STRA7|nr:hypothetical protein SAM23877_6409 [Streptomyces ambofaciens ATCC 23877]
MGSFRRHCRHISRSTLPTQYTLFRTRRPTARAAGPLEGVGDYRPMCRVSGPLQLTLYNSPRSAGVLRASQEHIDRPQDS